MIKSGTDLTKKLLRPEFDRDTVCEALLNVYGRSNGGSDELAFGDQDNPSVKIVWAKDGSIKKLLTARNFERAEMTQLESAIESAFEAV